MNSHRLRETARHLRTLNMVEHVLATNSQHATDEAARLVAGVDPLEVESIAAQHESAAQIQDLNKQRPAPKSVRGTHGVLVSHEQADLLYELQAFLIRMEKAAPQISQITDWADAVGQVVGDWQQARNANGEQRLLRDISKFGGAADGAAAPETPLTARELYDWVNRKGQA